jgi:hypothetical protein
MARCWEKAQGLLPAGYIARIDLPVICLHKPDGETVYFLNVQKGRVVHCTCPDFEKHRDYCKHSLLAQSLVDDAEDAAVDAQAAEWEATRWW